MQAQGGHPNHTKRVMGGGVGSKGSQSNAYPDELHEDDGAKYLVYLSHDYYGHGGINKFEGTQEYGTYHIQNMSEKLGLRLPHSLLGEMPIRRETARIRYTAGFSASTV